MMILRYFTLMPGLILLLQVEPAGASQQTSTTSFTAARHRQRTCFQSGDAFDARYDIRTDVAIAYGVNDSLTSRIRGWADHGYIPHLMTGVAWGEYEAYIRGDFDGRRHEDEGQADGKGETIWHHEGVPYMVPTPSYVDYITSLSTQAVDAGALALHLEEPEFWARAGYSEGFKKLWHAEYNEPWQRPDSSPDAFWRSSKLKHVLYRRTLGTVFSRAKAHAAAKHKRTLQCYVPTHSLLNYSQWGIVSPESSMMDLPDCDGYIAQVWTGTARVPNRYGGVERERTFETAYLEYATMHAMTAPTSRTVYFLHDPVEDVPTHTWDDYRANYRRVVAASLLFPSVSHFEVMPWPSRVFLDKYPAGSYAAPGEKITIPPSYAAELMIVVNALADMEQPECTWSSGSSDVGVLASDTMMFQRGSPWSGDSCYDEFFGLALPLVKNGMPARCVILEQVLAPGALEGISALLMSYDHIKPLRPEYNARLADWVRDGGVLIFCGNDQDKFNTAREWWNSGTDAAGTPRGDLLQRFGMSKAQTGEPLPFGNGTVIISDEGPASYAKQTTGPETLMRYLGEGLASVGKLLQTTNSIVLRRGPYTIGAALDECTSSEPLRLAGSYVDLFTSDAVILGNPVIAPGQVFFLRNIPATPPVQTLVLASSGRVEHQEDSDGETTVTLTGPLNTPGVLHMSMPRRPRGVHIDSRPATHEWAAQTGTALVRYEFTETSTTVALTY
ncbi:MAG: hypothetical protein ACR2IE_08690 [Candidatus Sumerlaeaceae bacterium]